MLQRAVPYILIAPAQVFLIALIGLPSIYVFVLSFMQSSFGEAPVYVGLANYQAVLTSRYFWTAVVNTVVVVNAVVYGELLIALGAAFLFASGVPCRRLLFSIMLSPYAVSPVVAVVMWRYLAEPEIGVLTQALQALGLPAIEWATNRWQALGLITVLSIWMHLPFTFVILYAAVLAIPKEQVEAARIDGAGGWQVFRHVSLPNIVPAILVATLFRFVFAFRLFTEVWLLTGGGPVRQTEVLATYLYREGFRYHNFGTASATGWLMLIASILVASYYLLKIGNKMRSEHA
jgi:multiple sugar transport system permease protein